ncbi:MAG TPA: hypothetical protein VF860_06420 [Candidatus Acidoferrales bacterium]
MVLEGPLGTLLAVAIWTVCPCVTPESLGYLLHRLLHAGVKTAMRTRFSVGAKHIWVVLVAMTLLVPLQGCLVTSVFPLFDDANQTVFDPSLVGAWRSEENGCTLEIRKANRIASYYVEYSAPAEKQGDGCWIDNGKSVKFWGELVQIGTHRFADLEPTAENECSWDLHSFYKLDRDGDSLAALPFDSDWVARKLREKKLQVEGRIDSGSGAFGFPDTVILASKPKKLRDFARTYADDPAAFVKDLPQFHFVRVRKSQQSPTGDSKEKRLEDKNAESKSR